MDIKGLSQNEVNERILRHETNTFKKGTSKSIGEILVENIFSLFNFIIIGIILFVLFYYFRTRDSRLLLDCVGIATIAIINTVIAIVQEIRAKIALDKVNLLLVKTVKVVRDGTLKEINHFEIVKDDIIRIESGAQIIVDGKIISSNHLEIDESLLTGESVPIEKNISDDILSGSFCVSGTGYYIAEKVGQQSYANQITHLAKKYKFVLTPLQKKLDFFLKMLFSFALLLVAFKVIFNKSGNIPEVDFVREIATILTSLIPQGLILTASITYAIGVVRISKIGAIIQRLNAIESFSSVKIVCMDKTGTLTQNKLKVNAVTPIDNSSDIEEIKHLVGTYSHLLQSKNSTSKAIEVLPYYDNFILIDELPFSSANKFSLAEISDGKHSDVYILGASDILSDKLSSEMKILTAQIFSENNLNNFRNLIFGKISDGKNIEDIKKDFSSITFSPICFISISDTVREDVINVLNLFRDNGIEFKILSGDSSESIASILSEIGWNTDKEKFIAGYELDKLNKDEFRNAVHNRQIFSRLKPTHKLEIIKVLKSEKIFTAMVGDGVNDLPAIKEADMGIAMEEGSAVTKETADIVLLKNKFSLLPEIFNEGNKIVNSVNLVSKLFLTKNFTVIFFTLLSFLSSVFPLFEYPITPRRVSLINIFAIGLPSLIISFKNKNITRHKDFIKDIMSYVFISSVMIVLCSFLSKYIVVYKLGSPVIAGTMIAISIVIILSIANFLVVSRDTSEKPVSFYLYSIALIIIYITLVITDVNSEIFRFIKKFYEIESFRAIYWTIIIIISIFGSILLSVLNRLREKFLK